MKIETPMTAAREDQIRSKGDGPATVKPRDVIVFCRDAEQVRAGFALALDAMVARDDLLMTRGKGRET